MKILLATRNRGKLEELKALLEDSAVSLHTVGDFADVPLVEEDQPTLEGNAIKRAEVFHEHTGLITVADDTGLEVDALEGAPGVRSARFAGEDADDSRNRALLLERMALVTDRSARFRTVVACVTAGSTQLFMGTCEGHITETPRGTGGFGYDPIFVPRGETRTFAEMRADEKNAMSHRGKAIRKLADYLRALGGDGVGSPH